MVIVCVVGSVWASYRPCGPRDGVHEGIELVGMVVIAAADVTGAPYA